MTCHATTDGPRRLPCVRTDEHERGHVFDCGDVLDRHDISEASDEGMGG